MGSGDPNDPDLMLCFLCFGLPIALTGLLLLAVLWSLWRPDPPTTATPLPDPGPRWGGREKSDAAPSEGIQPAENDVTESPPPET